MIRRNIESGYTVEYPTDGMSFPTDAVEYANAGGSVVAPEIIPMSRR